MSQNNYDVNHSSYENFQQNQAAITNHNNDIYTSNTEFNLNNTNYSSNYKSKNYTNPIYKSTPNLKQTQDRFESNHNKNHYITKQEKFHDNLPESKRENSFINLNNKSQIEPEEFSLISQDSNKLRMQLMEKDKIIIEYNKILKETERVLENTKKLNYSKDELINNLKDDMKNLKFKLKNSEGLLQNKNEEFEKFRKFVEEKIFNLNSEKLSLEEKFGELSKIYENNQMEYQNTLIEYKKMEKQLKNLNKNFSEKNEQILNYEKQHEELKKENKNIPLMKKQFNEMEKTISDLKNELKSENLKKEKLLSEKEELEKRLRQQMEENRMEKDANLKIIKMSYDIENLKKEIEEKLKENEKLSEKNKHTIKENDYFVQFFSNELNEFLNTLENIGNIKNGIDLKNINLNKNKKISFNTNNNSLLNFKYELVNKNFDLVRNKFFENYNEFINFISRKEKKEIELESQLKELSNERSNLLKEISSNKQKLIDLSDKNNDISSNYEKLFEDFKILKEKFVKAKSEYEEEKRNNENISKEIHLFISNCYEKLKNIQNFSDLKFDSKFSYNCLPLDYIEKLLYLLDILTDEHNKLSKQEKELYESLKMTQIEIKNSQDEKEAMKFKLDKILIAKEEDTKNSEITKNEELKRQREILYQKIASLTNLLEESNSMISLYENENKELKEKLNKTEFNLRMLTKSHLELENSITGNASHLQCEIDDKENKYNNALREIELKNIHIESIENILKRKEEEIARLNEVLFIYKNNQYIRNEEKQAEERKSFIQASECKEIKNQNDKYEQHVGYQNNYNNNNNQNNISIKEADNFNNDHNNINKAVHSSHNNYESDYSYNYNQNRNHCYNNSNCENKNFMSESGNRFLINEEKEKELQKLISVYNMDKSELSVQDERNESSVTNKSNTKKVPGRIYSIKKAI